MRAVLYMLAAVVTFIVFAVAFAPASLFWRFIAEDVNRAVADLQVLTVDGSIWEGESNLRYREFPPARLEWQIDPLAAATLGLELDARLAGDGLDVTGDGVGTRAFATGEFRGYIDSRYINAVSTRYGLTFPGRIDVETLELTSDLAWFTAADGLLHWGGGRVILEAPGGTQILNLPALDAVLGMDGRNLQLDVTDAGHPMLQVTVKPDGWAVVDIKARMLIAAGLPWQSTANSGASALILEEKLF